MKDAIFIGIDWGTSSARAFAFDARGEIIAQASDQRSTAIGIQSLRMRLGREPGVQDFEKALLELLGDLGVPRVTRGHLPTIIACGMIGSKQGLIDAGYLSCPTSLDQLSNALVKAECGSIVMQIVPGLSMSGTSPPDFMRGEETQILGCTKTFDTQLRTLVFPGSHSKWVRLDQRNKVQAFQTYLSGELFAAAKDHTIVGRMFATASFSPRAFEQGLKLAQDKPMQLQKHLFSVRALGLSNQLPSSEAEHFLSGLLIGHEIQAALSEFQVEGEIGIVGSDSLCERYKIAFDFYGKSSHPLGNTSATGLWQLYAQRKRKIQRASI